MSSAECCQHYLQTGAVRGGDVQAKRHRTPLAAPCEVVSGSQEPLELTCMRALDALKLHRCGAMQCC